MSLNAVPLCPSAPQGRAWFEAKLAEQLHQHFGVAMDAVVAETDGSNLLVYGDFMVPGADPRVYEQIKDRSALTATVEEYLMDYNAESKVRVVALFCFVAAMCPRSRATSPPHRCRACCRRHRHRPCLCHRRFRFCATSLRRPRWRS
jgi:hypothetical protein